MTLLNPLLLFGALGLLVPLWLHLVARQTNRGSPFPSLMFVKRVPVRTERRRKIREPLLCALRCLALGCLVLGFTRPFLPLDWLGAADGPGDETAGIANTAAPILLALDVSLSMRANQRWPNARQQALALVDALPVGQRAGLLSFDHEARVEMRPSADRQGLKARIRALEPGQSTTRYGPALRLAEQVLTDGLNGDGAQLGSVILVTDLQAHGFASTRNLGSSSRMQVRVEPVLDPAAVNTSIVALKPAGSAASGGNSYREAFEVQIRNHGASTMEGLRLELRSASHSGVKLERPINTDAAMDARRIGQSSTAIPPVEAGGMVSVTLPFDRVLTDSTRVLATLIQPSGPDGLADDDLRYAVAAAQRAIPVLVVAPLGSSENSRSGIFIKRALALAKNPTVKLAFTAAGGELAPNLEGRDLVILNGVALASANDAASLSRYLRRGGALLVLADTNPANEFSWPTELAADLAGRLAATVHQSEPPVSLVPQPLPHPLLRAMGNPLWGGLASARVMRYRAFEPHQSSVVLARTANGAPLLAERRVGAGLSLLLATGLEPGASTLGLSAGFAPWLIATVQYAAGAVPRRLAYVVGDNIDLPRLIRGAKGAPMETAANSEFVVESPDGTATRFNQEDAVLKPVNSGFYEVHHRSNLVTTALSGLPIAVNPPAQESNLDQMTPEAFMANLAALQAAPTTAVNAPMPAGNIEATDSVATGQSMLWWYLLAAGLAALALETLIVTGHPARTSNTTYAQRAANRG